MRKRALLAVFLSLLVILGYNYFLAQKYPSLTEQPPAEQKEELLPSATLATQATVKSEFRQVQPASPARQLHQQLVVAKDIIVETDLIRLTITSSGARIKSCQLKLHPEEKFSVSAVQQRLREIEQAEVSALPQAKELLQREKENQEVLLARLIQDSQLVELVSLPAVVDADFSPAIIIPEAEQGLDLNTGPYQCDKASLTLSTDKPAGQLEFTYTYPQGRKIKKTYFFFNSNYGIGLDITFEGWERSDFPAHEFLLFIGPDVGMPLVQRGRRSFVYQGPVSCFQTGQQVLTQKEKYSRQEQDTFVRREHRQKGKILWAGLENKYFLSALIPAQPAESVVVEKNRFSEQKIGLTVPWQGLGKYSFTLYLGAKKESRLKEIDVTLGKAIDYGFFGPIARATYQVLVFFSRWTHNFGWAIVLLCLITKIIFYPLTHHSFESMQKMQMEMKSIQPEMDALRARLKDNPQKLNKETMELYRKKGINPMASCQSGCLPMLLQMPVFFALYGVLYNSIELRGTPFLGWVSDLSAKDPYYILPILMGVSMFVQQKLTGISAGVGIQQEQAKMMGIMMPVILTWIFASLPSGVVLYWLTFNILTAAQQVLTRKKQQEQAAS